MVENNVLANKTIDFAIRIVNCYHYLANEKKEFVMSKQVLRSGTSIGANVHECIQAQSRADFVSKLNIALKEASETSYWLTILYRTEYINKVMYDSLKDNLDEIIRIIVSSIKTTRNNDNINH